MLFSDLILYNISVYFSSQEVARASSVLCSVCKADLNASEERDSAQSTEAQCAPHTPLMMCSVKMVDCRTMALIPPVNNDEKEKTGGGEVNTGDEDMTSNCVSFNQISVNKHVWVKAVTHSGLISQKEIKPCSGLK